MTGINAYNNQAALYCRPNRNPNDWCGSGPRTQPVIDDRHNLVGDCYYKPRQDDRFENPFRCRRPNRDLMRCWPGGWQGGWPGSWQGGGDCGWQGRPVYPGIDDRHNQPRYWTGGEELARITDRWGSDTMAERAELLNLQGKGTYRNLVMHSTPNSYYLSER